MEVNKNPFPQLELFPRLAAVGRFVGNLLTPLPTEAPDFMSEHYRGAAAMLDRELYDGVQVDGFLYEGEQLELYPGEIGGVVARPTLT